MKLSVRLTVVVGLLGLVTIAGVSSLAYWLAAAEARESVDNELTQRLTPLTSFTDGQRLVPDDAPFDAEPGTFPFVEDPDSLNAIGDTTSFQVVFADGTFAGDPDSMPTDEAMSSLAVGEEHLQSLTVDGTPYRVLTVPIDVAEWGIDVEPEPVAIQLYRDVTNEERALSNLAVQLIAVSAVGVTVVAVASWFVGRWLAQPIIRLTDTAEHLAELDDVPGRVEIGRSDEIGRLADSYNRLMSALEIGREQQRRLVADASHELRTPLTSLRMRVEYLQRNDLDADRREQLMQAAVLDAEQLSTLVSDLVDLAADVRSADETPAPTKFDDLVGEVAERTRLGTGREIVVSVDDTTACVRPTMIRRALQNLVDNAVKYSPEGPITIASHGGAFEVWDEGPGIAPDDAEHVFDRFFRSPKARSRPGNGIGLAIVQQVADAHGGRTWVGRGPSGGAIVGFSVDVD